MNAAALNGTVAPRHSRESRPDTPYYLYDLSVLRARVDEFRAGFRDCEARLYFATMANDCPDVLGELASLGVGACVNSIQHLELALSCGFRAVQFTSSNLSGADLMRIQAAGVAVNLDSTRQIRSWAAAGGQVAGLRINCASLGTGNTADRIGISAEGLVEARQVAGSCGISLNGLHLYVGTNFPHHSHVLPAVAAFFELAESMPNLEYLNIGGGVGVNYAHLGPDFDVMEYGAGVIACWQQLCERIDRHIAVVIEPGRSLVASCGKFMTTVTDVKELAGERFLGVDASIAIFPRPFHHPESPHAILLASPERRSNPRLAPATVVGRTTFSRDILGRAMLPMDIEPGDLLEFSDAGAYCQSMRSRFLGQQDPEIVVEHGEQITPAQGMQSAAATVT
jgi:diaminopimelate decarboxylase